MSLTQYSWRYAIDPVAPGTVSSTIIGPGPNQQQTSWAIFKYNKKNPSAKIDLGNGTRYSTRALAKTAAQALAIVDENGNQPKSFR